MHRTTRRITEAVACLALGSAFTLGCVVAADSKPSTFGMPAVTAAPTVEYGPTAMRLTPEQIDVLTEGDDPDHPWESCTINTDYWVTCPDGASVEYPYSPPEDDGSITDPGAFTSQAHLTRCKGTDVEPHLPCRVLMRPTYVVGGDGVRHEECYVTLLTAEDSEMVCTDDTVWAS